MFSIDAIMSTDLVTIRPTDSLADARRQMHTHHIHHLPVVDDHSKLVGVLTQTNVLAASDSILRDQHNRIHARDIRVNDVMVKNVVTIDEHASVREAALLLEKHGIGCLPVTSDGKMRGIITDTDFVGIAINLLEQIEETEPVDGRLS